MDDVVVRGLGLAGVLAIVYLAGLLADRWPIRGTDANPYPHLTRVVLGLLCWIAALFSLSACGWLNPVAIWAAIAVVTTGAAVTFTRGIGVMSWRAWPYRRPVLEPQQWLPLAAVALVLVALFLLCLRPIPVWDANTYHLTIPKIYIEHGGFRAIPFNVYSNWPLNIQLLFALGLLLKDYLLATLVHVAFAGLIVVALVRVCQRHGDGWAGPTAAALFLANGVVLLEGGIAYVDLALTFFFVMATWFLLEAEATPAQRRRYLLLTGIACGLMAGVKLPGLFGLACMSATLTWIGWRERRLERTAAEIAALVVLPAVVLTLPWIVKSYWYTGNPIYPFLFSVFGGVDWNPEIGRQFQEWQHGIGMGRTLVDYLMLPVRVILDGSGYDRFDGTIGKAWLVLIPVTMIVARRDIVVRRILAITTIYFACWAASSQQMRFLIPAVALLSAAAGLSLQRLAAGLPHTVAAAARWTLGALAAIYLLNTAWTEVADGRRLLRQYWSTGLVSAEAAAPPTYRVMNANLPPDARILFLNTNHGFFSDREYIADSFFEASQINALLLQHCRSAEDVALSLRSRGITHVMVAPWDWGVPYPDALYEFLDDEHHRTILYRSPDGHVLLEVTTPP